MWSIGDNRVYLIIGINVVIIVLVLIIVLVVLFNFNFICCEYVMRKI